VSHDHQSRRDQPTGELWGGAKQTAGNAWSGIQNGVAAGKKRASETWEGAKDSARAGWGWVKSTL